MNHRVNNRNYQKELDKLLESLTTERVGEGLKEPPTLLLHSCCAPCSSYTLEYLSQFFRITVLYFNPNIMRREEYEKRVKEQERLIKEMGVDNVTLLAGRYEPREFVEAVKGMEQEPEGGKRCWVCYELRIREAAILAKEGGYDYFCTTLSISPLKHADWLNDIGEKMAQEYGVKWLPSDFKKKGGYKRSIELSKEYNLYRQNFCGCEYSKPHPQPLSMRRGE
ncbi:MAG: epoxyqueuosine reductase QueH [Bacteroidaceae bacterium]|nr:epoxyqueuosine reductase QueH [Bacteroidaceae bacterium]